MISIIVIGKNEAPRLPDCFMSIRTACRHLSYEIIYVDSGSSDNSLLIAQQYARCFLLKEDSPTPGLGRRIGTKEAKGEWLLFLDGDMQLSAGFLEKAMMHAYRAGSDALTGIRHDLYYRSGQLSGENENYYNCTAEREAPEFGGALFIRKDILEQAGGWSSDTVSCEEQELHSRLLALPAKVTELPVPMILNTDCNRDARSPLSVLFSRRRLGDGEAFRCAMAHHSLPAYLRFKSETFHLYELDWLSLLLLLLFRWYGFAFACMLQSAQLGYFLSRKKPRSFITQKIFFFSFPLGLLSYRKRNLEYQAFPGEAQI